MRLLVVSHKVCWRSAHAPSGFATDGGFPFQIRALSELFDATVLCVPVSETEGEPGLTPLTGQNLSVVPLGVPAGRGVTRKIRLFAWVIRHFALLMRAIRQTDAVHAPIPGDVGTIGLLLAMVLRRPLFVRHCGNWEARRTAAEHFWRWLLEQTAGTRTIVLATGGCDTPPSLRNRHVQWIFSTSLTAAELKRYASPRTLPSDRPLRLIIACRQEHAKGTAAVIEGLELLGGEFPNAQLDVVGDGGAVTHFRALASRLGVADRVHFHGKVDHDSVITLLRRADVFCFPTRASEGFPKAVLEALACGLPVVTTRVSVLASLIDHGCGFLLDSPTGPAVARGVRWCIDRPDRYKTLSDSAIATAGTYSLERWRDVIGSLLTAGWGPLRTHG